MICFVVFQCNEGLLKRCMAVFYELVLHQHGKRNEGAVDGKVTYTYTARVGKVEAVILHRYGWAIGATPP